MTSIQLKLKTWAKHYCVVIRPRFTNRSGRGAVFSMHCLAINKTLIRSYIRRGPTTTSYLWTGG